MATRLIEPRKRGADPSKLTANEQKFVMELLAAGDWNLAEAVRKAYPKCKNPAQYGTKLMHRPRIKAILGKLQRQDTEKLELDRLEVLRQLWWALTRKVRDFADADGFPLPPDQLPEHCQSVVDGYKVRMLKRWKDDEGASYELQSIEYKLTPHAVAREQAMKHRGLFAPEEVNIKHKLAIDWDEYYARQEPQRAIDVDVVEGSK